MKKPPLRYRQMASELDSRLQELEENGALDPPRVRLVLAAAATTQGVPETVRGVLEAVLARGAPAGEVREAILQSYLFIGYPRVINALAVLRDVSGEDAGTAPPDLRVSVDEPALWEERGQALCARIYGPRYAKLLETMVRLSPDLPRWMVLEGYGKVLSRPHLDTKTRELVAVGSLVPLRVPEQLRAHSRGALNVGASPDEVRHALRVAAVLCPRELSGALGVLERVLGEVDRESF